MPTNFVLLSTQRSGSTWVIDMLNSHPNVVTYSELLLQDGRGRPRFGAQDMVFWESFCIEQKLQREKADEKKLFFQYLDNIFKRKPGIAATGFKVMYGQYGAYPDLRDYLLSNRTHIAHLIRRNYLDVIMSRKVAAARDVYHVRLKDNTTTPTIRLNITKLLDHLVRQEKAIQGASKRYSSLGLPYVEVFHEDLQSDQANFDTLLKFLNIGTSGIQLTSQLRKIITTRHSEVIENYSQVKQTLAGTRFSHLLQ